MPYRSEDLVSEAVQAASERVSHAWLGIHRFFLI